jgi:two-component system, chemotaxis family, CheB/CheR fusion protein
MRLGDLLGHIVDVRSRLGSGSVFSIEAALAPQAPPPLAPKGVEREPKETAIRSGSILIVEDDPAVRKALDRLLQLDGHHITAAADGEEAIAMVARMDAPPDVVILDYNLPKGLTGLEVLARLRERLGYDVPTLVLTGDISSETLNEIDRQGYRHRTKPISAESLTGLIQSLLAGRPLPPSPN